MGPLSSSDVSNSNNRCADLSQQYDVVVVGGGIYGATMAWEAVSRGLRTLLVEGEDFGGKTSANSLKTIHGGLRYLQDLDVKRLRESAEERAILQHITPHLVAPLECIMPTYKGLTRNRFAMQIGLLGHQLFTLGCNRNLAEWQRPLAGGTLSRRNLAERLPGFLDTRATGAARWYDAQAFNTERLVFSFVMSAVRAGADALNYAEVVDLVTSEGRVVSIKLVDKLTDVSCEIATKTVIDCTGPRQLTRQWYGPARLEGNLYRDRVRAWNIVMKRPLAPFAVGFRTQSNTGRLLFTAPWREGAIFGTWYDTRGVEAGHPTENEVKLVLAEINAVFPAVHYKLGDVARFHIGWLPAQDGSSGDFEEQKLAKHPLITHSLGHGGPAGLILVQGVKYTTARRVAQQTISSLASWFNLPIKASESAHKRLYGADFRDFKTFSDEIYHDYSDRFSRQTLNHLLQNYGSLTTTILHHSEAEPNMAELVPGQDVAICAEVDFIIKNEYIYQLSDLLLRRTDLGSLQRPADEVLEYCAKQLGEVRIWDTEEKNRQIKGLRDIYPAWT